MGKRARQRRIDAENQAKRQDATDLTVVREDGWINYITGMGLRSRDKTASTVFVRDCFLTDEELTALYLHEDLVTRIVDAPVDEAFRRGFRLTIKDEDGRPDEDASKELFPVRDAIVAALSEKEKWSRLYGGSAVFLNVQDGGDLTKPLDPTRVLGVTSLPVFDRRLLWPQSLQVSPETFDYEPAYYAFARNGEAAKTGSQVHPSRFIFGKGKPVDRITRRALNFWGQSVIQPLYDTLRRQGTADKSALQLLMDASQFVFKLRGLLQALATGNKTYMEARLAATDMARGIGKAIALDVGDKENPGEGIERSSASFAGISDVLDKFQARLSAACGIPVSILFGVGPAGMNATGTMDMELWYNKIRAYQEGLTKDVKALLALYARQVGFDPEEVCIEWLPLEELDPNAEADRRLKVAQADQVYFGMGLRGEQVLLSRFGKGEYSAETEVDVDELEASLAMPEAPAVDPMAQEDPEDPGADGTDPASKMAMDAKQMAMDGTEHAASSGLSGQELPDATPGEKHTANAQNLEYQGKLRAAGERYLQAAAAHMAKAGRLREKAKTAQGRVSPFMTKAEQLEFAATGEEAKARSAKAAAEKAAAGAPDWDESKHPRDENGKFA